MMGSRTIEDGEPPSGIFSVADAVMLSGWRHRAASALMVLVIALPLLATVRFTIVGYSASGTFFVNSIAAKLQLAFSLCLLPELRVEVVGFWRRPLSKLIAASLLLSYPFWSKGPLPYWLDARLLQYLAALLFLLAATTWFDRLGDVGLRLAFKTKVVCIGIALAVIFLVRLTVSAKESLILLRLTPLYSHIRHMNYDLVVVVVLGSFFWASATGLSRVIYWPAFVLFGYFCIWSGGRSGLICMTLALASFSLMKSSNRLRFDVVRPVLGLIVGMGLAIFFNEDWLFSHQLDSTFSGSAYLASSGRTIIWKQTLTAILASIHACIFGYGPEAYFRLSASGIIANPQQVVQPHNLILLLLLEFGVLGGVLLMCFGKKLFVVCIRIIWNRDLPDACKVLSVLLLVYFFYSMLDGIFYHAVPLITILLSAAYLRHCLRSSGSPIELLPEAIR